jgi:biopolymer transport protein TolR
MSLRQSAKRKRILRKAHREEPGAVGLNLVPMIDIFTSLLIFLLLSSTAVQQIRTPKSLTLPLAATVQPPNDTPVLTISTDGITLQGALVMSLEDAQATPGNVLPALKAQLMLIPLVAMQGADAGKQTRGEVNILADKSIPYALLKKIMATCGEAQYARISLSVNRRSINAVGAAGLGATP